MSSEGYWLSMRVCECSTNIFSFLYLVQKCVLDVDTVIRKGERAEI